MTKEEKQLLFKDLSARLPYGVKILHRNSVEEIAEMSPEGYFKNRNYNAWFNIETCKPYLCPMSSMTEEEKKEYDQLRYDPWHSHYDENICSKVLDWLNAHHFDYRGLIEKGLALEAPEGMYKTKYRTELQARYHLTPEEAREIIRTHGLGYSTLEFTQALQVIEEDNELNTSKPEESD